ncbi:myosin-9 isoform X4 [Anoplophora glabripennis]|uniref:myosin-9 isoform X4 n=1 Tax=Anoplophora glabripennis TaxID=217634 RepID=UPI000C7635B8|nr:myosin-9 isoform X4 [Anoplophora glabripennis]
MLIGLVRESVMQCFCHTCRAPLPATVHRTQIPITKVKTKPRTTIANQPKRVQFVTTEVRCQEKTRGGLRYEVILGEPEVKTAPPKKQLSPKSSMSVQDIEEKLKAAEERRQQLESNKIAALSAKMVKIEEASRKKEEQTSQFIAATRDALEQKMELHTEKREAYITDLKTKLKDHIENVEKTRLTLEQQTDEVRSAIEEKLKSASQQRDDNIKKMLDRLKEHNEHMVEVKQSIETTEENRKTEKVIKLETKLTAAEQKREQELQRKLEKIKENEKRAEAVRQNKANIIANKMAPSSG